MCIFTSRLNFASVDENLDMLHEGNTLVGREEDRKEWK